jgi:hypothetical protein
MDDSKKIEPFDKVSAIRYAKNLPQEDYTRYEEISSDQGGDQIRDKERSEIRALGDNDQTGAEITRSGTRSEQKHEEKQQKPSCGVVAVNIRM